MHQKKTENLPGPGVIPVYVFLDFDGVTHPWSESEDFRCLPVLEAVLRDYPETRVVIASDWRTLFSLPKLAARFSEDIRERVIDTTPSGRHGSGWLPRRRKRRGWRSTMRRATGRAATGWC